MLSLIEDKETLSKFSYLIDFDIPSSKRHISGYNHHRKLELGSKELHDITQ